MKFVQISDLHIGGLFKQDAFNTIVQEVNNDLKPDAIIISGDLTDDGLLFQFQQARTEINKFNCPNLIIFPGNHDYPDTGYANVVGISDAGDILRACLESKVDLVLCGHKHRPWLWNLGTLKIAYAGTACSWRYRGVFEDTYNIIDIRDGTIDVDIKTVGGKRMPLSEVVNRYQSEERKAVLSK